MNREHERESDVPIDDSRDIHGNVNKFDYICSIENFSQRLERTGEPIESPTCVIGSEQESKWCLNIYPNGFNRVYKEYVSVFLKLLKPDKAQAKYRLSILNGEQKKKNARRSRKVYDFDVNGENDSWGYKDFVKKDFLLNELNSLLVNDKLTILCQVEIVNLESENFDNSVTSMNVTTPQSTLPLDYSKMFESQLFTDCIVKVEDTEIKVHKAVLANRSPVFHDVFNSMSKNLQTNVVEINNFRVEVVEKMLKYIYTDDISDIKNMASEILAIATEYGLNKLKDIAVRYLCRNLSIENICERLLLAETFSNEELKENCQKFIIGSPESLRRAKHVEEFIRNYPSLFKDFLFRVVQLLSTSSNNSSEEISNIWRI
uniref:BTB domain-containing protein n=1 Tax=Strongyloides papillosus TaxID=174720 RepID=A0A0N5CEC8_STREA